MFEWLSHMENTKPLALVIFFVSFVGILIYVFSNKKRSRRLESYKNIPFQDDGRPAGKARDKDSAGTASDKDSAGKASDKDRDDG